MVFGTIIANSICNECSCSSVVQMNWPRGAQTLIALHWSDRVSVLRLSVHSSDQPVELISFTRLNWTQRSISLDWCQNDELYLRARSLTRSLATTLCAYLNSFLAKKRLASNQFFDERNREISCDLLSAINLRSFVSRYDYFTNKNDEKCQDLMAIFPKWCII